MFKYIQNYSKIVEVAGQLLYNLIMEIENIYITFNPSFKYYYVKNSELSLKDYSQEELLVSVLKDIDLVFNILKLSPTKVGYLYWKDAILISIICDKSKLSICNDVYPMIAKKYNKTELSIERAMRLCFDRNTYYVSIENDDNTIVNFMRHYLMYPRNSEILVKLSELIVSSEFQNWKSNFVAEVL